MIADGIKEQRLTNAYSQRASPFRSTATSRDITMGISRYITQVTRTINFVFKRCSHGKWSVLKFDLYYAKNYQ